MDTLSRLREIVRARNARPQPEPAVRELTYEPVDAEGQPLPSGCGVAFAGASTLDTPFGSALLVETTYEPDQAYGLQRVEAFDLVDPVALGLLTGRPAAEYETTTRGPVFFDLETTGLAGGAGTVAFLVGCGYFERGAFVVRQFFLPAFAHERALLHAVGEFFHGVPLVVSFNGRSFDVPVMETRWLFHRMPHALEGVAHLDMLPPARRLWKAAPDGTERSCRLVALEDALFGVSRVGDVPGSEIPQRYFSFVRTGDAAPLEPVLRHNRLDLLSLAAVTARAQVLVREGPASAADAQECLALGVLYQRAGALEQAEHAYRAAAAHPVTDRAGREEALRRLGLLLRRARRYDEAAGVWRHLLAGGHFRSSAAREAITALAIHHEHRERDLAQARALALKALQSERDPRRREELRYRLGRIERKLARPSGAGPAPGPPGGLLLTDPA
jgi:hypothetical protein